MRAETLTKAKIVDAIYEKTDRNRSEVKDIVESLLDIMKQAIKKDHALLISGFGKFEAYDKKARRGPFSGNPLPRFTHPTASPASCT